MAADYGELIAEEIVTPHNVLTAVLRGPLSAEEFDELIRPAFQQDEWILITVGAVLGFAVGELQGAARREPRQLTAVIRVPVLLTGSGNAPITGGRFRLCESGEVGKINSRRVATGTLPYPPASLLGRLTDRTREDFLAVGVSEGRPAGVTIISQGESDSSAMLLLHGSVKVLATDPAGERTLLAIRVGGDLVGEMAALDVGPRSATVIACTDIFFKRITRAELRNFLARHPDAAIEVATMLSERLRWADRRRIEHGRPASVRVARVLVDLYESYGTRTGARWDLGVPLTREELASIAGIKLSTAEKIIRTFQQDGLVSGRYRGIAVLDMARLRVRAEIP